LLESNPLDISINYIEFDYNGISLYCRECEFSFLMEIYKTSPNEAIEAHDYIHNKILEKKNTQWSEIKQHDKGCCLSCYLDNAEDIYDYECCCRSMAEEDTENAVLALYGAFQPIEKELS
jgi:hypothetical protein